MRSSIVFAIVVAAVLSSGATAQVFPGQTGFAVSIANSTAGSPCGTLPFTCTPDDINATAGDPVSIVIHGAPFAPFAILVAPSANQCITFPGVVNALVLDAPVSVGLMGTLNEPSPILACPAGQKSLRGSFPALPPGTSLVLQTVTYGSGIVPAFTGAVRINVI